MFTGTLSDCGLTYSADTVKEVSQKLYEYIEEVYGAANVDNLRTGSTYARCNIITSPGSFIIRPKNDPNKEIFCTIS